jgi:D-alanyl-lipoteichoic acid acyltransferase DltB (MBOAT superfamily)
MFFSSVVDFTVGYYMPKTDHKKLLMGISLSINLGLLMFFKYFNFFIESTQDLFNQIGFQANLHVLQIILPVGISFYTFQTLSYSLDVYKGRVKPEQNFIAFLNYVSFFPQLVAGPIERATTFLPQFAQKKVFSYPQAVAGMRLILYGFFKKMVVADSIGLQVDAVYANSQDQNGITLFVASALFFVQLYADFSAYTDIARGVGKLLGFELVKNFKTPLYSKSIPEFWSRWHISLTNWFRDYLFIWLASLNKTSTLWRIIATLILFLVIGFWHGANYTFIVFGLVHGLGFIPRILARKNSGLRDVLNYLNTNKVASIFSMIGTYSLLSLTAVLFRSENIAKAKQIYSAIFNNFQYDVPSELLGVLPLTFVLLVFEWINKDKPHPFYMVNLQPILRRSIYVGLILTILLHGYFGKEPFYYFQF